MSRSRRRIERRGRPRKANAKHRQTTRAGRGPDLDRGSEALRERKRRVTGREDLPLDGAAVLYGHDRLDRQQFDTLGMITEMLQRVARAWGGKDGSVTGMWMAMLGAMTATGFAPVPAVDGGFSPADGARRRLAQVYASLDGSRDLVIALAEGKAPAVVLHVLDQHVTEQDEADLVRLRAGLDKISEQRRRYW
jgi:hypothetical protein